MSDDLLDIASFLSDYRERSWIKDAACRGMDPNIFFPERGASTDISLAKETCAECPVKEQCREYGEMERFGFWGGVSARGRAKLRSKSNY